MKQRIVHLKQSGELLSDVPGERWTPSALQKVAVRLQELQLNAERLGVAGLLVVTGGGNVPDGSGRGAAMRKRFGADSAVGRYAADVIGRRSTVDNTIMLAATFEDMHVPYLMLAAPNSEFRDGDLGLTQAYTHELVQGAYQAGKIVLMAGGTGKSGQTTDAGVVEFALWQAQADPQYESVVLKTTKYDGVFENDPATNPQARKYAELSAGYMLEHYDRFQVVDRRCLELLQAAGQRQTHVELHIYGAMHSPLEALENPTLGTVVTSEATEQRLTPINR